MNHSYHRFEPIQSKRRRLQLQSAYTALDRGCK